MSKCRSLIHTMIRHSMGSIRHHSSASARSLPCCAVTLAQRPTAAWKRCFSSSYSSLTPSAALSEPEAATQPRQSLDQTLIRYDRAFLDLCRERLEKKADTSVYFRSCKQDPVRQAGVFMPLCIHKGVPSVLFTIRSKNMRNHRGEVSFPGGKRDLSDATILDTALREMEEEISIKRDQVEVLGEYSPMPNKDCTMKVHPFVGFIKEPIENIDTIAFNKDEVHKVFTMPIQDLIDPEKKSMVRFRNSKTLYPVWNVEQEDITIWGLTAFILDGVLQQIAKEGPTEAIKISEGARVDKYEPSEPSA